MLGGYGSAKDADTEVKTLATSLKGACETKCGKTFSKFDAVKYTSQVVAGMNYKIKVDVGDGKYVHIKVYQPLPHTNEPPKLDEVEEGKSLEDAF